ncbi:MAG: DegT/DnrJ/EryC1/StrS family aminotransferase [Longimicrobiales bacterium]|nr:DegT/DnrJ/EryC1/StrS family aminotransferase [Longimicrobiales bacterium]
MADALGEPPPPGTPLQDLTAEYAEVRADVREALERVLASQRFILGPEVEALEAEIAARVGAPHAVGVASGTDALMLALRALDLHPEDGVLVPAFTFFATAGAVCNAGLALRFCDVEPDTFNVSVRTLEAAWTPAVRAVVPVHLFGQMAPMEEILSWAEARGVRVVEDAAQALDAWRVPGSTGAGDPHLGGDAPGLPSNAPRLPAGAGGAAGAFSFFPTKNLGAFGDGGMVVTSDGDLADRIRRLRVHGGAQMYHHEMVGINSRLDALQAAVLRAKLPHLDRWTARRRRNAALYDEMLGDVPGVRVPVVLPRGHHVYNQYTVRVEQRDPLRAFLAGRGIGTGVYYPVPLHRQPCFASLDLAPGGLPVSEALAGEVLSLPVHPHLPPGAPEAVAAAIRDFCAG